MNGRGVDAEAREEIQQHIDRQTEANLAAGMTDDDARRAAVLDVGNIGQLADAARDARGLVWWDSFRSDVRHAFRQIRRRPGFASVAMLTMAIGVGATSAVFAVVDSVILRPLPYPHPERLYSLYEINSRNNIGRTRSTPLNFLDWRAQARTFDGMAAQTGTGFTLAGRDGPELVIGSQVTTNLLDVLAVRPLIGRNFRPDEAEAGRHRVAILTYGFWMSSFGGDASVIDRTTTINNEPYVIVGVLPPSFAYPSGDYRLLVPLVTSGQVPGAPPISRSSRFLRVVGRLRADVSEQAAKSELAAIGARLATEYPDANESVSIAMTNLRSDLVGDVSGDLLIVMCAVAFLLLMACVNVAGLALARGHARRRELAVRTAIGASRARLIGQLAVEGVVLFACGGAGGLLLAAWIVRTYSGTLPRSIPRIGEIGIDARFVLVSAGIILLAGIVASLLPAVQATRWAQLARHTGARVVSATRSAQRVRSALLIAQLSVAMVLLAGASLAVRSLSHVWSTDPGFNATGTMTFGFVMGGARYPGAAQIRTFLSRVYASLETVPGGTAVGMTTHLPLSDNDLENSFSVDGGSAEGEEPPIAGLRFVYGRYIEALGARLITGRPFAATDSATSERVAIVTENFAKRYIHSNDPIGARLKIGKPDSGDPWRTVVGVIADVRHAALDRSARPEVWLPHSQAPDDFLIPWFRGMYAVVRTSGDPAAAVPDIRAAMRAADPEMPLVNVESMTQLARESTAQRRLETSLLTMFASIALGLAGIGLFGVLAFHVSQHVQEFGVRLALGATPVQLLAGVIRRAMVLLAIGLLIGVPCALLMGRLMSALLYGVAPFDPISLVSSVIVMAAVTIAAAALPARRAMRTDPVTAIRTE